MEINERNRLAREDEPNPLARSLLFLLFCEMVLPLDTCALGSITERSALLARCAMDAGVARAQRSRRERRKEKNAMRIL